MKKCIKIPLAIILIIVIMALAGLIFCSLTEFKPEAVTELDVKSSELSADHDETAASGTKNGKNTESGAASGSKRKAKAADSLKSDSVSDEDEKQEAEESAGIASESEGAGQGKQEAEESAGIVSESEGVLSGKKLTAGQSLRILTWNIGYCGLGAGSDFFMDGGENVRSADKETVESYLAGVKSFLDEENPDIAIMQEVDQDSDRSYNIDQTQTLAFGDHAFALNFSVNFVPYPLPPIGKVHSGLLTSSVYEIESASRISLPCPFKWPVRMFNLKRCLLASYIPISGSDKYLVVVNLHLEAYDDGEGKLEQTRQLVEFIEAEYEKGNYVIAGGDFNQNFPGSTDAYEIHHPELWSPGTMNEEKLPEGFSFAYDLTQPTCRLDNQPYDPSDTENTDYYVIDGYIVSANVRVDSVKTINLDFASSDHNPVRLLVTLQ